MPTPKVVGGRRTVGGRPKGPTIPETGRDGSHSPLGSHSRDSSKHLWVLKLHSPPGVKGSPSCRKRCLCGESVRREVLVQRVDRVRNIKNHPYHSSECPTPSPRSDKGQGNFHRTLGFVVKLVRRWKRHLKYHQLRQVPTHPRFRHV